VLRDIQARHCAALVPLLDELQSFFLKSNSFPHNNKAELVIAAFVSAEKKNCVSHQPVRFWSQFTRK
jgi:hypothetical protein